MGQAHVALHARCAAKLVLQCWILTMSQTLLNPRIGVPHWEPKYPFDLVVAYEDLASRKRALQLYDHLAGQLLDEYDFQCAWWKFEHLQDRHLVARAADAATDANMIIVAVRDGLQLPATAKRWIEKWLPFKTDRQSALVALIVEPHAAAGGSCPVQVYLRNVALQIGMDFFCHAFGSPEAERVHARETIEQPAQAMPPLLAHMAQHKAAIPRWGINE